MTIKTNIGTREKIIKLYNTIPGSNHGKIPKIMNMTGLTYWQVRNAIAGRVKLERSPRSDKGTTRNNSTKLEGARVSEKKVTDFSSVEEFLEYQLLELSNELSDYEFTPSGRAKLIKEIAGISAKLKQQKIEGFIRRPEAVLIVRIMKRLEPDLTDDEIQKIYKEEYEKVIRDLE